MLMVEPDPARVESRLRAGEYRCPPCGGELRPWGFGASRRLRRVGEVIGLRPRRSRCASCLVTHVLLPTIALLRRRDVAEVIGTALSSRFAEGSSREKVARAAGVHGDTARGWMRRFAARAEEIRALFTSFAHRLDASLGPITARGSGPSDALEAIGAAAMAASRRFGPVAPWQFAAAVSAGMLLANTSCPLPPFDELPQAVR
jgi:hypothetical protein